MVKNFCIEGSGVVNDEGCLCKLEKYFSRLPKKDRKKLCEFSELLKALFLIWKVEQVCGEKKPTEIVELSYLLTRCAGIPFIREKQ